MIRHAILTLQIRLPGSLSLKEKMRTLQTISDFWGKQSHIAIKEAGLTDQSHQLGLAFCFFGKDNNALERTSNDILKWLDDSIESWVEQSMLEKF